MTVSPRIIGGYGTYYRPYYRPYHYPYRGFNLGIYTAFGYPYGYGYPYYYGYGYPYYGSAYYGYPFYASPYYGSPYFASPYYPYPYPYPYSSYGVAGGVAYGGVRIEGAPPDAQVFVDNYYAGIVSDFSGTFRRLNLEVGVHQIEIRVPGQPALTFEVNIQPGQTVTYHAGLIR